MSGSVRPDLHDLPIGDDFPTVVNAIIEIPHGVRTKYEYDAHLGVFKLSRILHAAVHYPAAYGFIPHTLWDDGDPLDILVVTHEPLFPGCLVQARPVALLQMQDEKGRDDKVLSVAVGDPMYQDARSLDAFPQPLTRAIEFFFSTYKVLEDQPVQSFGWAGVEAAQQAVVQAHTAYAQRHTVPG
jgi:inorganic pyrophosphatase